MEDHETRSVHGSVVGKAYCRLIIAGVLHSAMVRLRVLLLPGPAYC